MRNNQMKALWDNSLYLSCECGCDILRVTVWDEDDDFASLSMYKSWGMSFFQRLKQAWRYFRYGEFAYNEMIIDRNDAKKIAEFLVQIPFAKKEDGDDAK